MVDDKWLAALDAAIHGEMDRISQALTQRVKELAERYETPLAADRGPCGRAGGQGERASGKDGVRMEVREASAGYYGMTAVQGDVAPDGYKQTEVGVVPDDWSVGSMGQ